MGGKEGERDEATGDVREGTRSSRGVDAVHVCVCTFGGCFTLARVRAEPSANVVAFNLFQGVNIHTCVAPV